MTVPPRSLPLFVYGTLLSGGTQAALLKGRRHHAWVFGQLFAMRAGYPALSRDGSDKVYGQWVDPIPDAHLALLDHYEGVHEGLFTREVVRVHTERGTFDAWAWLMDDPKRRGGRYLPKGRWIRLLDR